MADNVTSPLPPPTPEHRRVAAGQFERANQVIATGNYDYGIQLLITCCKLDPANLVYRQTLRRTEKLKFKNNLRGSRLAFLSNSATKARLKSAKGARDYLKVLEFGEEVLARNPWDAGSQMDMAEAAAALGLLDLAVWTLEQARHRDPKDATVNRALARLYEKRGNFTQAMRLWELVRKAEPKDVEAQHKAKDLAASETIARGRYEEVVGGEDGKPTTTRPDSKSEETLSGAKETAVVPPVEDRLGREGVSLRLKITADPTNPAPYLQLAALYRRANDLEQARAILEQGLAPTGRNHELALELADLEIEPFRRNLIITEDKLRSDSQDEELRKIRIRLLKEINTRELDLFRQKADRHPTELTYRFELGLRLLRAGQTDEAIQELQSARSDSRLMWKALTYLGYCFKARNNWRLAQRNFEEALRHLPPGEDAMKKEVLFQLAQGYADSGDFAQALEKGYDLANLDFAYRDVGKLLDQWQAKLQKA